jgi:hypothetical protein
LFLTTTIPPSPFSASYPFCGLRCATEEIEYPLSPVEPNAKGEGTSTTVVHHVTLEGSLSGAPMHVNVRKPGPGEPPPVTCANLNEAL